MTVVTDDRLEAPALTRPMRTAAVVCFFLGFAGLTYWIPALGGTPATIPPESQHPLSIIQRVAILTLSQYTSNMSGILPILGGFFCVASSLQIPAAIGALIRRSWGLPMLRVVVYTKLSLYILSGLLLGLALFSRVQAGDPSWKFSAINWVADLGMVAIYCWLVSSLIERPPAENVVEAEDDEAEGLDLAAEEPVRPA
jgi:hypothetical protein